jgi:hypothetical protein
MKLFSGLVATALTATTFAVTTAAPSAADSSPSHPAAARAVSVGSAWLEAQLTNGILHNDEYDFDDLGLSADIAFALDAVGGHDATVDAIASAVAPRVDEWYSFPPTTYTGSAAKAIALAQVAGQDPTDFGGTDLHAIVEGAVATSAPIEGRVQNVGETDWQTGDPADSLNVISQSWAARALGGQGSALADEVMGFLLEQQCNAGFFRPSLTADKTSTEQGCDPAVDAPEVDTTALVVLNILATPDASTAAKGAAHLAASWLRTQQAADGSFDAGSLGTNANTTGLAGWALAEAGYDSAATRAAAWLRRVQVADLAPCATALAPENGAVVYSTADLAAARTAGTFSVPVRELTRRSTAQALPALANLPTGTDVSLTAPATAVEKTPVAVTVSGLGAGEPACVNLGGQAKTVTGTGSPVSMSFDLPAGAATHTFRLTTLAGSTTANTTASLAPAAPSPSASSSVGALDAPRVVEVVRNRFRVSLSCESAVACAGKVKVSTVDKVQLRSGKRVLVLAKRSYSLAPGADKSLVLTLTKPGRKLLSGGKVKVKAVQTAPDADRAVTRFWLKPSKG